MERLGIYIFLFFFLGLAFFERVRTKGETGSLWHVLARNLAVLLFAVLGYLLLGIDLMFPADKPRLLHTVTSVLNQTSDQPWLDLAMPCLFCAAATLIVAVGIWEMKFRWWSKSLQIGIFSLLIYPIFGWIQGNTGFLGQLGFYDHAGALLIWALPAAFVLGSRALAPTTALPVEKTHDLKGIKIIPGIKHRFLFSRGIGFTMIFLVLNAPTLVDSTWVISKTLTLIPASFTIIFANLFFYGLFGRNEMERITYAPPFFAIMAALVSTQACNRYESQEAILASVMTTFIAMLYLRTAPIKIRFWDPICCVPVFLIGGLTGSLMASLTSSASLLPQIYGALLCLSIGFGTGAILSLILGASQKGSGVTAIAVRDETS